MRGEFLTLLVRVPELRLLLYRMLMLRSLFSPAGGRYDKKHPVPDLVLMAQNHKNGEVAVNKI